MIKLEKTQVVGLEPAIRGMRNPMNSWDKSDSDWKDIVFYADDEPYAENHAFVVGSEDKNLMMRLAKGGSVHAKYRRMIVVYVDITAPLYWWKEFDTYKVGTVANSCSTMHKIQAKEFTLEDFSCEHLIDFKDDDFEYDECPWYNRESWSSKFILEIVIKALNFYRNLYNVMARRLKDETLTKSERKHFASKQKHYWWQMIQLLPSSYNQKRTVMLNYEVLAGIYPSRKDHKLDEWHDFCDWIRDLPYSEVIIGG